MSTVTIAVSLGLISRRAFIFSIISDRSTISTVAIAHLLWSP